MGKRMEGGRGRKMVEKEKKGGREGGREGGRIFSMKWGSGIGTGCCGMGGYRGE